MGSINTQILTCAQLFCCRALADMCRRLSIFPLRRCASQRASALSFLHDQRRTSVSSHSSVHLLPPSRPSSSVVHLHARFASRARLNLYFVLASFHVRYAWSEGHSTLTEGSNNMPSTPHPSSADTSRSTSLTSTGQRSSASNTHTQSSNRASITGERCSTIDTNRSQMESRKVRCRCRGSSRRIRPNAQSHCQRDVALHVLALSLSHH